MSSKAHVYIPPNRIERGKYIFTPEGQRKFVFYRHSKRPDELYTHVKLPTMKQREKAHGENAYRFGTDSHGIDLDAREAYIQIPSECMTQAWDKSLNLMQWYFNNPNAHFKVYFKAQHNPLDHTWDKPDVPVIGVNEICRMFPDNKEKALQVHPKRKKREVQKAPEKESKSKERKPKQIKHDNSLER